MADILIRGLKDDAVKRLKARAKRHGRSLQSEARRALEQAAAASGEEISAMLDEWKRRFEGRQFTPSADLIREDRER